MNELIIDPIIKADKAIRLLGLTGTEEEKQESLIRTALHYQWAILLTDTEIYGVPEWYVDSETSKTFIKGRKCLSIEFQSDYANAMQYVGKSDEIQLLVESVDLSHENAVCAKFSGFYVNDEPHYYSDHLGTMDTVSVDVDRLSFYRQDIESVVSQKKDDIEVHDNPAKEDSVDIPIIQQRIIAFRFWLVSTAIEKSPTQSISVHTLQECYEIINSPTRDEVWDKLNKIDKKLFRAGKDDFFKAAAKEVEFQTGRRPSN